MNNVYLCSLHSSLGESCAHRARHLLRQRTSCVFFLFFSFSRVLNALRKEYGAVFIAHISVCCLFLLHFIFFLHLVFTFTLHSRRTLLIATFDVTRLSRVICSKKLKRGRFVLGVHAQKEKKSVVLLRTRGTVVRGRNHRNCPSFSKDFLPANV